MIKKLIITAICFIVVIVGAVLTVDFLSKVPVKFTLSDTDYTLEIYNTNGKVASTDTSATIRLHEGDYYYITRGNNFSDTGVDFKVTRDSKEITVTPEYSQDYLESQLNKERPLIEAALQDAYPAFSRQFTIYKLSLYDQSKWAAGILELVVDKRSSPDYYRFVLEKKDGEWSVAIEPQIAIKASSYPAVPKKIIDSLYFTDTEYKS